MLRRLLTKIPGHLPKAWVTGMLLWCAALALGALCVIFGLLHWHTALMAVLALMWFIFFGFMGCIVWFMVERMFGRVTPWRRQA
jgi:hypothetical protein